MNRGYRVIWSEVKHAHVVVSEMAKRQTKGASSKAVKTALVATVGMSLLLGGYTANAALATNPAGEGPGVAIGTSSNAQRDGVVAIGKGGADLLIQTNKYHKKSNRTLILIMQPLELC